MKRRSLSRPVFIWFLLCHVESNAVEVDVASFLEKSTLEGPENEYTSLGHVKNHAQVGLNYETLPKLKPADLAPTQDANILPLFQAKTLERLNAYQARCNLEAIVETTSRHWPSSRSWLLAQLHYLWKTGIVSQHTIVNLHVSHADCRPSLRVWNMKEETVELKIALEEQEEPEKDPDTYGILASVEYHAQKSVYQVQVNLKPRPKRLLRTMLNKWTDAGTLELAMQLNLPDQVSETTRAQMNEKWNHSNGRRRLKWQEFIPKDEHARYPDMSDEEIHDFKHRKLKELHDQGVVTDGQDILTPEKDPGTCIYTLESADRHEIRFLTKAEINEGNPHLNSTNDCTIGKTYSWQGTY